MNVQKETSTSESVMLTDDEIVALSARSGAVWPTVTPTVQRTNQEELLSSVQRGIPSLVARGFLLRDLGGEVTPELGRLIDVIWRGSPVLATFVASEDLSFDLRYVTNCFHRYEDGWVSEVTTPMGLHYLARVERDECVRRTAAMLDQAVLGSYDESLNVNEVGTRRLCVMGIPPSPLIRIAVGRRGEILLGTLVGDAGKFELERPVGSGLGAIRYVLNDHQINKSTSDPDK